MCGLLFRVLVFYLGVRAIAVNVGRNSIPWGDSFILCSFD